MAEFDPDTGAFTLFSRTADPGQVSFEKISGKFGYLGEKRVLLYRLSGVLYLQVDDQRVSMENHFVELHFANAVRVLRVLTDGTVVFELTYNPPRLDPPLSEDPTPFIEEEDFDYGIFLANVSRDKDRQARMYLSQTDL